MVSSYSSQTTLKGKPFRPFEERWPAESSGSVRLLKDRPSAAKAARKMLSHWPSKTRRTPLAQRPA